MTNRNPEILAAVLADKLEELDPDRLGRATTQVDAWLLAEDCDRHQRHYSADFPEHGGLRQDWTAADVIALLEPAWTLAVQRLPAGRQVGLSWLGNDAPDADEATYLFGYLDQITD